MARVATLSLREVLGDRILGEVARILCADPRAPGFVDGAPFADLDDELTELEPFLDWDVVRGHGRGFFHSDAGECATRRVDLRGPTDLDPGPLPMEEAPEDADQYGHLLVFQGRGTDATDAGRG